MNHAASKSSWSGRHVAITGGAGFIGSTLAATLCEAGASVVVLDSFDPRGGANEANLAEIESAVRILRADVRDKGAIQELVGDADVLFNLAGQTSHQDSMTDPLADLDINTRAQVNILETCRESVPDIRIVYASTRQLYGKAQYLPVDEKHPVTPPDVNAINKISGEHYHLLYNRIYGLKSSIARLTNVYGPRMRIRDARQMFLGSWIGAALSGREFEVWGGEQKRDLSFVGDTVSALIAIALAEPGRIFNVGGSPPVSLLQLADLVVSSAGSGSYVKREMPAERKRIDIGDFYADDRLLQETTGWRNRTDIEAGLRATIDFYRTRLSLYL